jgi:hypothetical protein
MNFISKIENLVYTRYGIQEIYKKSGLVKETLGKLESLTRELIYHDCGVLNYFISKRFLALFVCLCNVNLIYQKIQFGDFIHFENLSIQRACSRMTDLKNNASMVEF